MKIWGPIFFACIILLPACKKNRIDYEADLEFSFSFSYGLSETGASVPFTLNTSYPIPSGEFISCADLQYFISDVILINDKNEKISLSEEDFAFYIDLSLSETLKQKIKVPIPSGVYKGIEFVFGFRPEQNISNRFSNPPKSLMFWPEILGGGYHYMKINGKWKESAEGEETNFGLHAGIGQTWENEIPTAFHQNYFIVQDSLFFPLAYESTAKININMDVKEWFQNPVVWEFKVLGGAIMQNQTAQQALKENGTNVFSVWIIN